MNTLFSILLLLAGHIAPSGMHTAAVIGEITIGSPAYAYEIYTPPLPGTHLTEEDLLSYIRPYAAEKHVKVASVLKTVECEAWRNDDGTWDATMHSMIVLPDGTYEDSWGLAQIHLPDHLEVSKTDAQDAEFSIHWMIDEFSYGNAHLWTCFRDLKAKGMI